MFDLGLERLKLRLLQPQQFRAASVPLGRKCNRFRVATRALAIRLLPTALRLYGFNSHASILYSQLTRLNTLLTGGKAVPRTRASCSQQTPAPRHSHRGDEARIDPGVRAQLQAALVLPQRRTWPPRLYARYLSNYVSAYLSIYRIYHLSICLPICLSVYLYQSIYLSLPPVRAARRARCVPAGSESTARLPDKG